MKFKTAIDQVRRYKFYITYAEFGEKLHITESAVKQRIKRNSDLRYDEAFMLADRKNGFDLPVKLFFKADELPAYIPVDYYENNKVRLERVSGIDMFPLPFEVAYRYNRRFNKDDFAVICMMGDKLDGEGLSCRNGDLLLIDVTRTDISVPGMFVYECEGGNYIAMAYIKKLPDGAVFKYTNPVSEQVRSQEYLDRVGFKVVGRIVKNLFFFA